LVCDGTALRNGRPETSSESEKRRKNRITVKSFFLLAPLVFLACGGAASNSAEPTTTTPKASTATPTSSSTSARPTCDAIDRACDPHEDKGGLAKECHDLGENAATDEATCVKRKDACLAACPAKS